MNARGSILSDWIIQIVLWLCDLGENLSVLERERERESFHTPTSKTSQNTSPRLQNSMDGMVMQEHL